jgi:hypothetical protein
VYSQAYERDRDDESDDESSLPFSRLLTVSDVNGETRNDIKGQLADLLDNELNPETDEFRSLVESSLLVRGQTASLYSYLGSQAHFRASLLLAGSEPNGNGEYKTKNNVLFGPHVTYGNLKHENLDREIETSIRLRLREETMGRNPLLEISI